MALGSHKVVARFAAERAGVEGEKAHVTRSAFYASHPWLAQLINHDGGSDRINQLFEGTRIDGIPVRVVELTGEPGDVVITHPLIAHSIAPNCASRPRFMRIARPRIRASDLS